MDLHKLRMLDLINFTRANSEIEPYGCSIYSDDGKLITSVTGNKLSPINHAEILAINECALKYPEIAWDKLTLYTTGEPCCMCASACCWSNLATVVFGTGIPYMIDLWGIESATRAADIIKTHPKQPKIISKDKTLLG